MHRPLYTTMHMSLGTLQLGIYLRLSLIVKHKCGWLSTDSSELELLFYLLCRDHRKLFVGDSRGRVYTWVVSDTQGTCIIVFLFSFSC